MEGAVMLDWDLHYLAHVAPPPRESLAAWSERCIMMGTRQPTAFPGPFRLANSPYMRGIMDALDDPATRLVVVEAAAQTGKTTVGYAWLAHAVATDPAPALVVYPSEDLARSNSATRIQPLFEDSPALAPLVPADRRQDWQLLQYRINGAAVHLTGGNSPAQVSSRPIRYVLLDEVDKYPAEALRGEADVVSLALQRQKTYWNRQAVMISTPTTPAGLIHRHFLRGDMREYEVPCPRCGKYQRLRWKSVKWPDGQPALAAVHCAECGAAWTEAERRAAIRAGRWTPTRTDGDAEDGVVSFHLPSILALWVSPADLAVKFSRVKNDPVALQDFVNSDLAEPYVPADARIANTQLRSREGDYEHGRLRWPASDDVAIYGGVDVQQDHLVVVLRQFRVADAASALVWRGHLSAFAELDGLLSEYGAEACCVDARYRSDEVYEAALRYPGIWPTIGVAGFRVPAVFEQQSRNIDEGRRGASGRNVQVLIANSNALLDMLHARVAGADGAPSWEIPRGLASDPDYVGQLTAMYRNNGAWVNPRKLPEHYADAEKLAILAAWYAGIRPVGDAAPVADAGDESEAQQ
jgi:hypothetical protein